MPKGKAKPKNPVVTKFKVGDKVRVKHGVTDTDYPDMPRGG
jgi:transcription antitermination factor NusG